MTKLVHITAVASFLLLAACEQKAPEVVGGARADATSTAAASRPAAVLPPSIARSATYRCKDKSVVYVNFLTDNLTVNVRDKEESPPTVNLKAAAAGEAFEGVPPAGEGFRMVGSGDEVTYTSPESGTQVCKA